ncbi:hypothetical protein [Microcoleus sp. N9_A3]|uniref:hypothetical protein n=1 Tax=Microcoleus sp. N9_A3 TaxID=3055382 RepID=UPI002FCF6E79
MTDKLSAAPPPIERAVYLSIITQLRLNSYFNVTLPHLLLQGHCDLFNNRLLKRAEAIAKKKLCVNVNSAP